MSQSADKNKLIIDHLLNAYSVDAIISSFYAIDARIIALIKCASEDFIHFNTVYRKYHEEINLLSANSRRLYACFNEEMNYQYAAEIRNSVTLLFDNLHRFENLIEFNRKVHEQVLQKLEQIFIPVQIFYQNLNTLRLLSANLKLDPDLHGQHGERMYRNIEDIFLTYPDFLESLKKLKKFVSNSCIAIGSLKKNYLDSAYHILSFCLHITDTILHKEKQAKEFKPVLEKILVQTRVISSGIINHLQCQETVQQKIEHVQGIHKEIIKNYPFWSTGPARPIMNLRGQSFSFISRKLPFCNRLRWSMQTANTRKQLRSFPLNFFALAIVSVRSIFFTKPFPHLIKQSTAMVLTRT